MDGRRFLHCAIRLSASSDPADLRSAVSRAYYAAFHVSLSFLKGCGIYCSVNSAQAHEKMPQCFGNSNIPTAIEIGDRLRSLRANRNTADYELENPLFDKQANVAHRVQDADEIIRLVEALERDRDNVSKILRPCAKNLGLNVP